MVLELQSEVVIWMLAHVRNALNVSTEWKKELISCTHTERMVGAIDNTCVRKEATTVRRVTASTIVIVRARRLSLQSLYALCGSLVRHTSETTE